ncbi:MAG: ATP-binding protein, partial [Elusimicrobiota bacterium]
FEVMTNPVMQNGKLRGSVVVFRDMTRRRRLEDMRREFVANVSHELRTPLASIKGYAETLRRGGIEDEENRLDFVRTIETHADRLTSLVDDLLELAAIESGKETLKPEPLVLTELAKDVIKHLRPLAEPKRVKLVCGVGAALRVSADKAALRRVLENLLTNAIKYNREGGEVRIDARADGEKVEINISDTGFGIPDKDLPHLFERFYRVDKARSRELGGTGLGLSIVRHIVENHGGRVWAESVEGKGTSFYLTLPFISEK